MECKKAKPNLPNFRLHLGILQQNLKFPLLSAPQDGYLFD